MLPPFRRTPESISILLSLFLNAKGENESKTDRGFRRNDGVEDFAAIASRANSGRYVERNASPGNAVHR
ncbi:hypothetical protein [Lysobacter sp. yr284]|uniref:hypothetical protein n=1 Tax=Lysobacter sp. yr284 TaxID=1761791 RepID=UPI0011138005|nr:hypothetical protein [Lysobacter sp. yr284]